MEQSTIRAFQKVCTSFEFSKPASFPEDFAQKRFRKKMEKPLPGKSDDLAALCWNDWISYDETLPLSLCLPLPKWYIVRRKIHQDLQKHKNTLKFGLDFRFPKGSQFIPNHGETSVEACLCRDWTCTYDNFDEFAELVYRVQGLKRAARIKYNTWFRQHYDASLLRDAEWKLYQAFSRTASSKPELAFQIFRWKLERVVTFQQGSRFATVPKNNEKRRPINVECFANILTQSRVGEAIRRLLKREYNLDLDTLAITHRQRISNPDRWATIDLKNASDSVSRGLIRFLFPSWFVRKLEATASPFVLGPDGNYYPTRKISAMGNGFTFELMTYILTLLCRSFDEDASSFGDDITVNPRVASQVISHLENVGFIVNRDKTFTALQEPFRESCGANYHRSYGYIKSFDFLYPETIGDCVALHNKAYLLSEYASFRRLYQCFCRAVPPALQGGPSMYLDEFLSPVRMDGLRHQDTPSASLPAFFVTPKLPRSGERSLDNSLREKLHSLNYDPDTFHLVRGWEWKPRLRSPSLRSIKARRHWAKYLSYLRSGMVAKDVLRDVGEWRVVWFVTDGKRPMRVSNLKG